MTTLLPSSPVQARAPTTLMCATAFSTASPVVKLPTKGTAPTAVVALKARIPTTAFLSTRLRVPLRTWNGRRFWPKLYVMFVDVGEDVWETHRKTYCYQCSLYRLEKIRICLLCSHLFAFESGPDNTLYSLNNWLRELTCSCEVQREYWDMNAFEYQLTWASHMLTLKRCSRWRKAP